MTRLWLAVCAVCFLLSGGATAMHAQEQQQPTLYDAQAVRVESSWGKRLLVRGREGTIVGKIGGRGGLDLAAAVAPSANAVREAEEFKRRYARGSTILTAGILAWGVGWGVARMDGLDPAVSIPAYTAAIAGPVLMAYGGVQLNKAFSALARSIWWYNRDLTRRE